MSNTPHTFRRALLATAMLLLAALVTGCSPAQPFYFFEDGDLSHYVGMATNIEYPDVNTCSLQEVNDPPAPFTISHPEFDETLDLKLEDAVRIALENGKVMRSLGVRLFISPNTARTQITQTPEIITAQPNAVTTVYEPAIFESDPIFGPEGALSVYDAQLSASMFWEKNDRPRNVNAAVVGSNLDNFIFEQDLETFQAGITKRTATGATFSFFNNTVGDFNNSATRDTAQDWNTNFEAGFRQPLLQGAGTLYNRIAGPFDPLQGIGTYLQFDGVIIARIRTDIRLADFEAGVRNFVSDVENAYWELYFAYRNLEARKTGRDSALQTWKKINELKRQGAKGGEADREAQSREQYFFFRGEVETALGDLYRAENRLRYMMGLAATDGRLIRPCDEPTDASVLFDWCEVHAEGLCRSVELRQQKWRVKQREMELIASKNLLLPRLDVVGRYRWLGLGEDLIDYPGKAYDPNRTRPNPPFPPVPDPIAGTDAFSTLASGDFQEWQLGLQMTLPIGFRQPLAAVRNQQLLLARERSVLQDEELEVSHQLAEAIRDTDTNYVLAKTNFNRRVAAEDQVEAVQVAYEAGTVTLDLLLEAQRRRADAEAAYYRALTDYNKAIMLVHFRKGSLLEYNGVYLAEGPWPAKAYFDATRRARARDAGIYLDYGYTRPNVLSMGPFEQFQHGGDGTGQMDHFEGQPTEAQPQPEELAPPQKMHPAGASMDKSASIKVAPGVHPASATIKMDTATLNTAKTDTVKTDATKSDTARMKANAQVPGENEVAPQALPTMARAKRPATSQPKVDKNVVQASGQSEDPFDWGDLSLGNRSTTVKAKPKSPGASQPPSADHESDSPQPSASDDRPAAAWKGVQR